MAAILPRIKLLPCICTNVYLFVSTTLKFQPSEKKKEVEALVSAIEILGATLEEACLKKGIIFSADLHPIF
jgi:hypothetical protein